ncbi:MAG: helix-turn-helix transcriptional regulator [Planctomycetota bacterium]|nr:helix-turn-helix transcriptional regulator [Planctomycetota bacterium]
MSVKAPKAVKSDISASDSPQSCGRVLDAKGRTTHYLVPAAEYEVLVASRKAEPREAASHGPSRSAIEEAARMLESSATVWHSADDVMRGIVSHGLSAVREQSGLTQAQLGKLASMPQSQVSRIEKDLDSATMRVIRRIAAALSGSTGRTQRAG